MLHLENVSICVGAVRLLDGVTVEVEPGRLTAVVGPNGAGKSTLMRVASGERQPDAGRVTLGGKLLSAISPDVLARRRAVLPQESALAFPFTAYEVVALGRTPYARHATPAENADAVWEALESVDAAHLAHRRYPTLSGGEKQRVHLARTLAQLGGATDDAFLLLDEPTNHLDLTHQHAVLDVAHARAQQGTGVLAVLHDLNMAARYADHLVLLHRGRVHAQGPPAEVLVPDIVRAVFGLAVMVVPHPCLACPLVVTMPDARAPALS